MNVTKKIEALADTKLATSRPTACPFCGAKVTRNWKQGVIEFNCGTCATGTRLLQRTAACHSLRDAKLALVTIELSMARIVLSGKQVRLDFAQAALDGMNK